MLTYRCAGIEGRDDDNTIVSSLKIAFPEVPGGLADRPVELGIKGPSGDVYRVVLVSDKDAAMARALLRRLGLSVSGGAASRRRAR